jgi:putative CocE/NonD family hydrolase
VFALPLALVGLGSISAGSFSLAPGLQNIYYDKIEYRIPMRDGVKLYTAVYVPKIDRKSPILMERTPYSAGPYGTKMADVVQNGRFARAGYIFAYQDVRGRYMSEGEWENVRPQLKPGQKGIDESTDTYDTVDFLVKNVPRNNGSVGLTGISYPGFYAGVGAINTHPALKAASPQAPTADWFKGDDVHHNGAFYLQDNFNFSVWFDVPRKGLEEEHTGLPPFDRGPGGDYDFFLRQGAFANLDKNILKGRIPYWNELGEHPNYDQYWQDRALPDKMKNVRCAVLNVGGWFDAEDMWGALNTYSATERQNPRTPNYLVMGPWSHGQWWDDGTSLGGIQWGSDTSAWYRDNVEFPFFERFLNGKPSKPIAEATMFQTGENRWRQFEVWPPKNLKATSVYLAGGKALSTQVPPASQRTYRYDPAAPTPYLRDRNSKDRPGDVLILDERWAGDRKDVVSYRGPVVSRKATYAGPVTVDLWVATTGTDADFVVKVLDEWPAGSAHAGEQRTVRSDVMRGKFRNSLSRPEPFKPGVPTRVRFQMNDVLHTFMPGHRMVIQVQSAWFPLVDRNPNQFLNIYKAKDSDFKPANITVFAGGKTPSRIILGELK